MKETKIKICGLVLFGEEKRRRMNGVGYVWMRFQDKDIVVLKIAGE